MRHSGRAAAIIVTILLALIRPGISLADEITAAERFQRLTGELRTGAGPAWPGRAADAIHRVFQPPGSSGNRSGAPDETEIAAAREFLAAPEVEASAEWAGLVDVFVMAASGVIPDERLREHLEKIGTEGHPRHPIWLHALELRPTMRARYLNLHRLDQRHGVHACRARLEDRGRKK